MLYTVVLRWGIPNDKERRRFTCGRDIWDALQVLGKEYGWTPKGTQLPTDPFEAERWIKNSSAYEGEYKPDDPEYPKQISAEDANNWANALNLAMPEIEVVGGSPAKSFVANVISDNVSDEEWVKNCRGVSPEIIKEFIDFLRKGPFLFSYYD